MLSGVKFISRDQLNQEKQNLSVHSSVKERKKLRKRKEKQRKKKKKSHYGSSDEEGTERIEKSSKRRKKWYSSDASSSSSSSSVSESDDGVNKREKRKRKGDRKASSDDDRDFLSQDKKELARKEMGLEWMLKPENKQDRESARTDEPLEEPQDEEDVKKPNPRELNPYFKDNGHGYPEEESQTKVGGDQLLSSSVVGDGGASWRLKALKRAKEQAAREGKKLDEVVEERWGSLGQLAVSVASCKVAPARAHLNAIKDRKRGAAESSKALGDDSIKRRTEKVPGDSREYLRDVSFRHPEMREPKVHDSLSWRKRKGQNMSEEDTLLISAATSSLNKFSNDGSFMRQITHDQNIDTDGSVSSSHIKIEEEIVEPEFASSKANNSREECPGSKQALSANQLAAKVLQLRMKGRHQEAEKLVKDMETMTAVQESGAKTISHGTERSLSRYVGGDMSVHQKRKEEDADMHLAQKIIQNKQYSMSGRADDEYDYDGLPAKKRNQKRGGFPEHKLAEKSNSVKHILTQQERCMFCFENPTRPRHLIVSIANFTYLMLPQWQPVVQGHCCILPMQHELATRNVDNNVWDEIRNFKKCLLMMFAKQDMDVVFLETVMGLAQQRRHCLVECIPLPREIAREAPLYFKKAIDEAEDEWSQHNAKKLIDTSLKGLRGSIPKDFPYFHVEFGLNKGFIHVIDDERQFKSSLGLNVIRGMLRLPEEDMHRRRKHDSVEAQKAAVSRFAREWEPFDWTRQLE